MSLTLNQFKCFSAVGGNRQLFSIVIKSCLNHQLPTSSFSIRLKHDSSNFNSKHSLHYLNKGLSIKYANQLESISDSTNSNKNSSQPEPKRSGKLLVLIAWIRAAEKNLDKYREIYLKNYGFDVLTVYTNPSDFILPTSGSQKTAHNLVNYLVNDGAKYSDIVIHGFSVGAYEFGEVLLILSKALKEGNPNSAYHRLVDTIRGMIFDSAVDVHGAPIGVSRSVVGETLLADIIQYVMRFYMWLAYPIATKHYIASSTMFHSMFLRCPALLLFSKKDSISNSQINLSLADEWSALGINVTVKDFNKSRHVTHYRQYPDEYEKQIDDFIRKLPYKSTSF